MNEYQQAILKKIVGFLLFIVFAAMVIIGQKTVSYGALGLMLLGLFGLLALLYVYNSSFVKQPKNKNTNNQETNQDEA